MKIEQLWLRCTVRARADLVDIATTCLFQLNDYSCLGMKDIPSDGTCTSRPQSWHIPRATSISPMPVMGTNYARAATDRSGEQNRDPVKCKLYEARGP